MPNIQLPTAALRAAAQLTIKRPESRLQRQMAYIHLNSHLGHIEATDGATLILIREPAVKQLPRPYMIRVNKAIPPRAPRILTFDGETLYGSQNHTRVNFDITATPVADSPAGFFPSIQIAMGDTHRADLTEQFPSIALNAKRLQKAIKAIEIAHPNQRTPEIKMDTLSMYDRIRLTIPDSDLVEVQLMQTNPKWTRK